MKKLLVSALLVSAAVSVSACSDGNVKDKLGLRRSIPDEFRVVANPPLSVPPEFTVRPPAEAKAYAVQNRAEETGKRVLFEKAAMEGTMPAEDDPSFSKNENAFLNQLGANTADPNIKNQLRRDEALEAEEKKDGFFGKVASLGSSDDANDEPVVNALEEKKRIGENVKEGKSVTDGETPVIEKKSAEKTGLLNRIFGW